MSVVIEDASIRDLAKLHTIETACFREEAFTKAQIAQLLKDYNSIGLVARVNKKIVGFVIGDIYVDRQALQGHICTIEVLPEFRLQGIGQKLLRQIEKLFKEKGAKSCTLEVREDNVAAVGLYTKLGYEVVGVLKNYYMNAHGVYLRKILV